MLCRILQQGPCTENNQRHDVNVLKGKFNGGPLIFGYVIDNDRRFQIDPDTAPVVEDIFNRYANGESIRSIIDDLQSMGLDNRGKPFSYNFINRMLKNRRYIGEYVFKDIVNTEAIPPIIAEELFEKCQRRLESNKYKPASFRKVEDKYFLTGKIFCGCCNLTSKIQKIDKQNAKNTSQTWEKSIFERCF